MGLSYPKILLLMYGLPGGRNTRGSGCLACANVAGDTDDCGVTPYIYVMALLHVDTDMIFIYTRHRTISIPVSQFSRSQRKRIHMERINLQTRRFTPVSVFTAHTMPQRRQTQESELHKHRPVEQWHRVHGTLPTISRCA